MIEPREHLGEGLPFQANEEVDPTDELFGHLDVQDFMFSVPIDLDLGITNFDATGFI